MKKKSRCTVSSVVCLLIIGMIFFFLGCENPSIKKAGEKIKESSVKTGEAAKELGQNISEETKVILEEIKKGTNVIAAEIKEGGIFVSKKGEVLIDQTKEEFSEVAITAKVKAKFARSPKVSALHINVTTEKCQVILAGTVHCKEEIIEAINLAMSVEGVENVTSLLEVRK
jgi:predicted AAA+ superfamily ATPase